jgi:hypothetical protein
METVVGRKGIREWAEVATKIWNHFWQQGASAGTMQVFEHRKAAATQLLRVIAKIERSGRLDRA